MGFWAIHFWVMSSDMAQAKSEWGSLFSQCYETYFFRMSLQSTANIWDKEVLITLLYCMLISSILNSRFRLLEGKRNDPHASFCALEQNVLMLSFQVSRREELREKGSLCLLILSHLFHLLFTVAKKKKTHRDKPKGHDARITIPQLTSQTLLDSHHGVEEINCAPCNYSHVL